MSCIRQRPRQMDIRKGVVSLATGAGAVYLLYKAIKAGIKCQPPFCSASPICIARECPRPGRLIAISGQELKPRSKPLQAEATLSNLPCSRDD